MAKRAVAAVADEIMRLVETSKRFGTHNNAFGFLRLLFASLVIVSHTPELVDGNANREPLNTLFHSMTFGGFAVNGFFVISGFLITGSLLNSRSTGLYLLKRAVRIYPAFAIASLFCLLIVAPLSGGVFKHTIVHVVSAAAVHIVMLARPMMNEAFPGQHYNDPGAALDGAMWTIQYEFFCYLLIIVIAKLGILRRPLVVPVSSALLLIGAALMPDGSFSWLRHSQLFPGPPAALPAMFGMFLAGAAFYLLRQHIRLTVAGAAVATVGLTGALLLPPLSGIGFALCGSYLIFAAARLGGSTWLGRINDRTDISYGLYLYAWPIEQLLIRHVGTTSLLLYGSLTWIGAAACGWISWTLIEKPALAWAKSRGQRSDRNPAPSWPVVSRLGALFSFGAGARSRGLSRTD